MIPALPKLIFFVSAVAFLALGVFPVFAQVIPIGQGGPVACGFFGINCAGGETLAGNLIPLINLFIDAALFLIGTAAVIFLIYAGFKYIFSRGDEQESAQAKRQIVFATLGIIVALSSWTIHQAIVDVGSQSGEGVTPVIDIASLFINAALLLIGTAAVIFLIYAGFKYISSRGDEQESTQAKRQIIFAVVGIVVALGSGVIKDAVITTYTSGGAAGQAAILSLITPYVELAILLSGIATAIFLIYAGFKYILSRGEEQETTQAKHQIVYALSGLILIGLADLIVNVVIGTASPENLVAEILFVISKLISLLGVAAVIYVIIAGVRYMSAQGDQQAIDQAKRQLIYSVIGLIVIGLSVVITNFFINAIG